MLNLFRKWKCSLWCWKLLFSNFVSCKFLCYFSTKHPKLWQSTHFFCLDSRTKAKTFQLWTPTFQTVLMFLTFTLHVSYIQINNNTVTRQHNIHIKPQQVSMSSKPGSKKKRVKGFFVKKKGKRIYCHLKTYLFTLAFGSFKYAMAFYLLCFFFFAPSFTYCTLLF